LIGFSMECGGLRLQRASRELAVCGWRWAVPALALLAACERPAPRPERELLLVTADSTYWITASGTDVKSRGVPMLVARVAGRFTELYVADDDRSYYDAVFIGHRLFARDLQRGDSVELHRDSVVARLAAEYAQAHPGEQPLSPDEPENDNAAIRATSDIEILGIHGAYLSFEHHTDVDTRDEKSSEHRHEYRRGVLDARNGKPARLAELFGEESAARAAGEAITEWNAAKDSLIARAGSGGTTAARARKAIADFRFDRESFAIGSDGAAPTIRFAPPARGVNPEIEPIELSPRRITAPGWWTEAAAELPIAPVDSSLWANLKFSSPVERVIWLDSTVTDAERAALLRAFDEAANYDGQRQVAAQPVPQMAPGRAGMHLGLHDLLTSRAAGARVAARVVGVDDARRRECARPRVRRLDPRHARQDRGCLRDASLAQAVRHRIG
jgi:hypothetical protein